jgi:hypothetical protein
MIGVEVNTMSEPTADSRTTGNTPARATATALTVLAAFALSVAGPVTSDANVHTLDRGVITASKPVPPPVWCGTVRFCPYSVGT